MAKILHFNKNAWLNHYDLSLEADVLVLGGGPAGTWAALTAARAGASVVLVDKGYCGTSGATAPSGTGVWYVPPDAESRRSAKDSRDAMGGHLASRRWMDRVLDKTYIQLNDLADSGYPFPVDQDGVSQRRSLQGPEYMRLMRKLVQKAGVRILDQSPALELLADNTDWVAGAAGLNRQTGDRWAIRAGAVVVATGGCAFLSKALGCNVLTGDGYLMAAEAGAEMSGMEFSNAYGLCPAFSSITKSAFYRWATFYYEDGSVIEGAGSTQGRSIIAKTLQTQPVYARLDNINPEFQESLRLAQPNFFLSFDRQGINPFNDLFPVALRLEGTVRGTGGIRIIADDCSTSVPGLYAAGDAATREPICGGFTGGGSHNAAWAISSGSWAGKAAAVFAAHLVGKKQGRRPVQGLGEAGLKPTDIARPGLSRWDIIRSVQNEVFPFDKNLFRNGVTLNESLDKLHMLWREIRFGFAEFGPEAWRGREAVAMAATARWMYSTALLRTETRGMHKRLDHPASDPCQHYRLISGGLDEIWVRPEQVNRGEALAS
jgi:succinate dehydrogenase/fumarate reductase flavoprotein subunit